MKDLIDTSGPKNLKKRIKDVQYIPEPTVDEFYNPVPINLRRPLGVQIAQIPKDQIDDEFSPKPEGDSDLSRFLMRGELLKMVAADKKKDEFDHSSWGRLVNLLPSATQVALIPALMSGNYAFIASRVLGVVREQNRLATARERKRLAKKKQIEAAKKKRKTKGKKKNLLRTDAKGKQTN